MSDSASTGRSSSDHTAPPGHGWYRGGRQSRRRDREHHSKNRTHTNGGERRRGGTARNHNSPTGVHDSRFSSPARGSGGGSGGGGGNWRNRGPYRRDGRRNRRRDLDNLSESPRSASNGVEWPLQAVAMNPNCPDYHVFDVYGGGGLQLMPGQVPVEDLARMGYVLPLPWMHPEHHQRPPILMGTPLGVPVPEEYYFGYQPHQQQQPHEQVGTPLQAIRNQHEKRCSSPSSTLTDTDAGQTGFGSDN